MSRHFEPSGVVTFLTDFGTRDHYVGCMKGVVLTRFPAATLVDISHEVEAQDVRQGALVLADAIRWFPSGAVHVAVVDPGVGTERGALVLVTRGAAIVAPNNGLVSALVAEDSDAVAWSLDLPELGLPERSATFHGRDLFAPAGALFASGALRPEASGRAVVPRRIALPGVEHKRGIALGTIWRIDHFGNLITSIRATDVPEGRGDPRVQIDASVSMPRWVRTYGDAKEGDIVALFGSAGWVEIAAVGGSAARRLGLDVGSRVAVTRIGSGRSGS